MSAQRQLIEAEFDLDYALQWHDLVGIAKATQRIKELQAEVRRERQQWVKDQLRGLFASFKP